MLGAVARQILLARTSYDRHLDATLPVSGTLGARLTRALAPDLGIQGV